jgi:hypothetical protein
MMKPVKSTVHLLYLESNITDQPPIYHLDETKQQAFYVTVGQAGQPVNVLLKKHQPDLILINLNKMDEVREAQLIEALKQQNTMIPVLVLGRQDKGTDATITTKNAGLYKEIAHQVEESSRRSKELEALRQASYQMTANLELKPLFEAILEQTMKLIAASDVHIFLYDGSQINFGIDPQDQRDHDRRRPVAGRGPWGIRRDLSGWLGPSDAQRLAIPD